MRKWLNLGRLNHGFYFDSHFNLSNNLGELSGKLNLNLLFMISFSAGTVELSWMLKIHAFM